MILIDVPTKRVEMWHRAMMSFIPLVLECWSVVGYQQSREQVLPFL